MSKDTEMPEAYKTEVGRIIRSNPEVHKAVMRKQLNYTPCSLPCAAPESEDPEVDPEELAAKEAKIEAAKKVKAAKAKAKREEAAKAKADAETEALLARPPTDS